jgi:hypothetical protein
MRFRASTDSSAFAQQDAGSFETAFVLLALLLCSDSGCVHAAEAVALRLLARRMLIAVGPPLSFCGFLRPSPPIPVVAQNGAAELEPA